MMKNLRLSREIIKDTMYKGKGFHRMLAACYGSTVQDV